MYKLPKNPIKDGFLIDVIGDRPSIGIVIDSVCDNQIAYEIFSEIFANIPNKTDYSLFTQIWDIPVLEPPTGLYQAVDLLNYYGDLIITSVNGLCDVLKLNNTGKVLYYIYNPHELTQDVSKILRKSDIILVCRSDSHKIMVQKMLGDDVKLSVVPDFDLKTLEKLIIG